MEAAAQIDPGSTKTKAELAAEISPAREERIFLLLSIFIGIISGLLVVSFRMAIDWLQVLLLGSEPGTHRLRLVLVPAAAGLVIALLTKYVFPQVRGSGVNQTKAALYISNGYISIRTVIGKFLLSSLAIGSGHSLGPEDPSLQIGAGRGVANQPQNGTLAREAPHLRPGRRCRRSRCGVQCSNLGDPVCYRRSNRAVERRCSRLDRALRRGQCRGGAGVLGSEPMFRIPVVTELDSRELLAYAVLGFVGGVASLIFAKALGYLRPRLREQTSWTIFQPAVAGLLVGGIGYFGLPQVMGAGYEAIDQANARAVRLQDPHPACDLQDHRHHAFLLQRHTRRHVRPDALYRCHARSRCRIVREHYFPYLQGSTGSYALVGMGVLFAAFLRVPLTSVFMVLEVSGNYSVILPVILANTIAYLISRALQPVPIFELFTHQDGLYLPSMEEEREERHDLHFEDALGPINVPVFKGSENLGDARKSVLDAFEKTPGATAALIQCKRVRGMQRHGRT